ncbi:unnamed protein product [Rotaria sp. Silwood1]|nr:unnamed protein product [Rotaria sp. Silwood1]
MSDNYPLDFRLIASSQFQMLALLCRTANTIVLDAIKQFVSSEMMSNNILFRANFEVQIAALVEQLQSTISADASRTNQLLLLSIAQNFILCALRTNFYKRNIPGTSTIFTYSVSYANNVNEHNIASVPNNANDICNCLNSIYCKFPSGFFNRSSIGSIVSGQTLWSYPPSWFFVSGMQVGCIPQTALLSSILECFFNQTCLTLVASAANALVGVTPLNASTSFSNYNSNTLISDIFDKLMLESLHNSTDFQGYFEACAPKVCTYSYPQRFSLAYIMTTLISIIGGLSVAVSILSSWIVKFLIKKKKLIVTKEINESNSDINLNKQSIKMSVNKLFVEARNSLITLNLFTKTLVDIRHGIYSTRIYIVLLGVGAIIMTVYSTTVQHSMSVIVQNPTLLQFEKLYQQYPSTLSCPCQHLSVMHSSIMTIWPRYHQVCSSTFVQNDGWLKYWPMTLIDANNTNSRDFPSNDFRVTGQAFFQQLQTFCSLATEILANAVEKFNRTNFVSAKPLAKADFNSQASAIFTQFKQQVSV